MRGQTFLLITGAVLGAAWLLKKPATTTVVYVNPDPANNPILANAPTVLPTYNGTAPLATSNFSNFSNTNNNGTTRQ